MAPTKPSPSAPNDLCDWTPQNAIVPELLNQMLDVNPPPSNGRFGARATVAVCCLAHNNHVMNGTITGGPWSAFRIPPPAMGKFLRAALGGQLVILASAIGKTNEPFPVTADDSASVDYALSRVARGSFVIDLRPAKTSPAVWEWLSQPRHLRSNVRTQTIIRPSTACGAFVFLDTLTAAHQRTR